MMNFFRVTGLLVMMISANTLINAQCDINLGCSADPELNIDPPTFDANSFSILLDNIEFGGFECTDAAYQAGVAIYIYQLLPDGSRMTQCSVINEPPYNVVGTVTLGFGQVSFCSEVVPIGSLSIGPEQGFEACDGAYLEIEAALFVTTNMSFDPGTTSVFSELMDSEYYVVNLGNLEININNEFPGEGQPLTSAKIKDFNTDEEDAMEIACGVDIELYLEGLSRIANCLPYADISTGISSELTNEFYYTINDGEPIIVLDASTGATGGQLTGPDEALAGLCYAGVLTSENAYLLEFSELPADLCEGSKIVFTLKTTDIFSNITAEDQFTVTYTGGTGCGAACAVLPHCDSPCYAEYNPNPVAGSSADPTECVTLLDCATITANGLESTCAALAGCVTSVCPVVYLNDDNLPSLPDALCEGDLLSLCFDLLADNATFNPALIEFNYELTFNGTPATVTLENIFTAGTQIDPAANGQICFETIIPEGPDACQLFDISLTIESVFYRDDANCPSNNVGFSLNLSALPASEGDDLNSLVPLLSLAGFNPLTLTGYPNTNFTAAVTQAPACDGTTLGIVEIYASNGTLCETVTGLGTAGTDGACPANNAIFPEYTYTAFETYIVPDQNEMDSVVVNACAISVTLPTQTIACAEACDVPGCTNVCATNYNANATVDDGSCTLPDEPPTACFQIATFNEATCIWEVTGMQMPEPTTACYQTATFNETTCIWDVSGEMPTEPATDCFETASFNNNPAVCDWEVVGIVPDEPSVECFQTATFNDDPAICMWEVSGEMPVQPLTACYQTATFNDATCMWEVTGTQEAEPPTACYETATFNEATCAWIVTGDQPAQPTDLACYQSVGAFDNVICMWQVLGEQPPIDDGCDLTADSFDEATCMPVNTSLCEAGYSLDEVNCACLEVVVMGCTNACASNYNAMANADDGSCMLPEAPVLQCYQTTTFNNTTCVWDISGTQPEAPTIACYQTANFDDATCSWVVSGEQDPQPPTLCYQTSTFDEITCMWLIEGEQPPIDDGCDLTDDSFDEITCMAINTPNCAAGTSFDAANCACTSDPVPGCTDAAACNYDPNATVDDNSCTFLPDEPTDLACYETTTANLSTCTWEVTGEQPPVDDGCALTEDTFDEATCIAVNTPNCSPNETFDAANCTCISNAIPGCTNPCATNFDNAATEDDGTCALPDPDDACDLTEDTLDETTCAIVNTPNCPSSTTFNASTCTCDTDVITVMGCTNICAVNYDENATIDDGSCMLPNPDDGCDLTVDTFDETTCTIVNTPNCADGTTFNATTCNCDVDATECSPPQTGTFDCE